MLAETSNDLDRWHAVIREEFDDVALFNVNDFDIFVRWICFCPQIHPVTDFNSCPFYTQRPWM
jgi:hypothetical protein